MSFKKNTIYILTAVIGLGIGVFLVNDFKPLIKSDNYNKNFITNFNHSKTNFGGDFTLMKHDGSEFTFSSLNGKPSLLYFGFTNCPDFCPTSLQIMDAVANKVDVNRLFVSVDPERDTKTVLNNYVTLYKEGLIGLTGSLMQTDEVAKKWYIYYSFNKKSKEDKNYIVDHTTYLYLTDKNGHPFALIRPEATPDEIVEFIEKNL
ncbi:MAG: protein SCO1/2 [Alphaproteobacteria bacterium]|jgi:protein SCO1/2